MRSLCAPVIGRSPILEQGSDGGMFCKLIIRNLGDGSESILSERQFDQPRITIGRGPANDVVLTDPSRMVSAKHAEIRAGDSSWVLLDKGSTNGTVLNGVSLTAKQEYALHAGDRVTVGPFQVMFEASQSVQDADADRPPELSAPGPLAGAGSSEPRKILYLLRRAIADLDGASDQAVDERLDQVLRRAMQGFDPALAKNVVQSIKGSLTRSPEVPAAVSAPPQPLPPPVPQPHRPKMEVSPGLCEEVVGKIFEGLNLPVGHDDPDRIAGYITRILQTVFVGLADAVRGRRAFQKEFEVETTRILAWTPNPIKHAENADEIAVLLLNPAVQGLADDQVVGHLHEVFQDLSLHQLGVMAGFRECVRGLLKELDPATLRNPGSEEKGLKGIGLLGGGTVRADAASWHRFLEKHRQLTEEEVRVFEQILAPHFAKGYLSVQKTRKRP